jgi:DNA-binding CsgD family transcriptional regulator
VTASSFSGVIEALGARLDEFEELTLPVYVLDRSGNVVWTNQPARELLGDALNRPFRDFLAPDYRASGREHFVRKMLGSETSANYDVDVIDRFGRRRGVSINSISLSDGHRAVGVFGVIGRETSRPHGAPVPDANLSPRQSEVLRHLEAGATTREIAERMGVSIETVRNHVRAVLRALGVRSRLEAVVEARRRRSTHKD